VIVRPDGAPWITDGGLNAILRVDPRTRRVRSYPLPANAGYANLNTATFDRRGLLWFTGQSGIYGRLDPKAGKVRVFRAPRGEGPYGITTTPSGDVYYASLAGSYLVRIDTHTGKATVVRAPTEGQGARRAWADSRGRIWISEWNASRVGMYDPGPAALARLPNAGAAVRQILGRPGEVWGAESGTDRLVVVKTR
jgi:virginiamycin B lyase